MITPQRSISVVKTPLAPEWKNVWDRARGQVKEDEFQAAAKSYEYLMQLKSNIEEATWEYCKVLFILDRYRDAGTLIAKLLEADPQRLEYRLYAGKVALQLQDYNEAILQFGWVLEKNPAGQYSTSAMKGLAETLRRRGRKDQSFPLSEQLLSREIDDFRTVQEIAKEAATLGQSEKSRWLFKKALEDGKLEPEYVAQAVDVFQESGDDATVEKIIQSYLDTHPDNTLYREKLLNLYEKQKKYAAALEETRLLLKYSDSQQLLLQKAATLSSLLKRQDQALLFLGEYERRFPGDSVTRKRIEELKDLLAVDLLILVENDGTEMLWEDLAELKKYRSAIFEKMARALKEQGKDKELLSILKVIYNNSSNQDRDALRLAGQLDKMGLYREALDYINKIQNVPGSREFYVFRGDLERIAGLEIDSLSSYNKALELDPENYELRNFCIELAGNLGFVQQQLTLFQDWPDYPQVLAADGVLTRHIEKLGYNYLIKEAERVAALFFEHNGSNPNNLNRTVNIGIQLAKAQFRTDKKYEAEQTLRLLLNKKTGIDLVLCQLLDFSIAEKDSEATIKWLEILREVSARGENALSPRMLSLKIKLYTAQLLSIQEEYANAEKKLNSLYQLLKKVKKRELSSFNEDNNFTNRIIKELAFALIKTDKYSQAFDLLTKTLNDKMFDADLFVLLVDLAKQKNKKGGLKKINKILHKNGNLQITKVLKVINSAVGEEKYSIAATYLKLLSEDFVKRSVIGRVLLSKTAFETGKVEEAIHEIDDLLRDYSEEPYFCNEAILLDSSAGELDQAKKRLATCYGVEQYSDQSELYLAKEKEAYPVLALARLTWTQKDYKAALKIYETLLSPSIMARLTQQFSEKNVNVIYPPKEESIWGSMLSLLQEQPLIVDELMEPQFLFDNLGNDTGEIVAGHFAEYSRHKLINSEYQARDAIYNRNYTFAKQSYLKLHEKEKKADTLADLASIYNRIGEYRKEAQVYQDIRDSGVTSPKLQRSMERSSQKIQPQNTVESGLYKTDGRDGYVDLETRKIGTSFWFIHDLNKDIQFSYWNNRYESVDGSQKIGSNTLSLLTHFELSGSYLLTAGVGIEKLNGESETSFLGRLRLDGQLDDNVKGFIEYDESLVYDTVESIRQREKIREVATGLTFDTTFGFQFGGDLLHRSYTDENAQNRFHGFSSYSLYGETTELALRYEFNYLTSDMINPDTDRVELDSDSPDADRILNYWSPETYTEHEIGLYFQHDFLGFEDESTRKMSFYSVDCAIGIEDEEELVYSTEFDIFLEMSPHLLLKGNFTFITSDNYEETGMFASLRYRW